jgi:hypothetical protein
MRASTALVPALVLVLGCKGKPKPAPTASPKPAPTAATDASATESVSGGIKLVDAGSDPKSRIAYAFANTTRMVDATVKRSQSAGAAVPGAAATFHFAFTATPKPNGSGGATIDVKVTKLEISLPAGAPTDDKAAMRSLEKSFVGVVAHVDTTASGSISDPQYEIQESSDAVEMMSSALEMLVIPLPVEPVGVGAKWVLTPARRDDDGTDVHGSATMTLVARDTQTATIKVEATNSGRLPIPDPRAPKGSFLERTGSSHSQVVIRFDGVAARGEGDMRMDVTQKVPGQPDQALSLAVVKSLTSK